MGTAGGVVGGPSLLTSSFSSSYSYSSFVPPAPPPAMSSFPTGRAVQIIEGCAPRSLLDEKKAKEKKKKKKKKKETKKNNEKTFLCFVVFVPEYVLGRTGLRLTLSPPGKSIS